jgi:hypothetical protein
LKSGIAQTLDELSIYIQIDVAAARDDRDQIAPAAFYGSAGAAGQYTGSAKFIEVNL